MIGLSGPDIRESTPCVGSDTAEIRQILQIERGVRCSIVGTLERVVRVPTENESRSFVEPPLLRQGELRPEKARSLKHVPSHRAGCERGGISKCRRIQIRNLC